MPKKSNTPGRKKIKRPARLNAAAKWLNEYNGKNIVSGYAKWFGVDKICALSELKILGIEIDPERERQIIESVCARTEQKRKKKKGKSFDDNTYPGFYPPEGNIASVVDHTSNGFPYGLTWEEWEQIKEENQQEDSRKSIKDQQDDLPF
ncbi:MAG: hypothetical protein ACOC2E_04160 [Bacteroidota bacterium]